MRWRRHWWDDQLDEADEWADECCRRAEETHEPPFHPKAKPDPNELWPRIDTVWDEMREDRLVRRGLEG